MLYTELIRFSLCVKMVDLAGFAPPLAPLSCTIPQFQLHTKSSPRRWPSKMNSFPDSFSSSRKLLNKRVPAWAKKIFSLVTATTEATTRWKKTSMDLPEEKYHHPAP